MVAADAAVMAQTATKFERADEALQKMLSGLMVELAALQTEWQGSGGRSFEQVKLAWEQDQRAIHDALRQTAGAIRTAGRQYDTTDTDAGSRVASTNRGGIQLPL
ncbi:WXG100 family type VII secretion target [Micromonospora polyrhachis]|nr:WXG100 family type VII secretion target [Micromonospora polyrhachis]